MNNLLNRINYGYDGLIRQVRMTYVEAHPHVLIEISAQLDGEWVNIEFLLESIHEYKIAQSSQHSHIVMSDGIGYTLINDIHYIDFSPYAEESNTIDEIRRSTCYFGATRISYKILPYREHGCE